MATRNVSPAGLLLRTSRLFSIPEPLPNPPKQTKFESKTQTLPYPTRQAITRPTGSRWRSDAEWGLKRGIPSAAVGKGWQPTIRIISQDTDEQVTEYHSANDHARTLLKWQEMNVPMRVLKHSTSLSRQEGWDIHDKGDSAFGAATDFTDRTAFQQAMKRFRKEPGRLGDKVVPRMWKFENPPISDMSNGDFKIFLEQIKRSSRPQAFKAWLLAKLVESAFQLRKAEHNQFYPGVKFDEEKARKEVRASINIEEQISTMRSKMVSASSELNDHIEDYLCLPPRLEDQLNVISGRRGKVQTPAVHLTTHPSAGLSYMFNKSYIENHPLQGPREQYSAIPGRVISVAPYTVGVGGIVTQPKQVYTPVELDVEKQGGPKLWVVPLFAAVNRSGKIELVITTANSPNTNTAEQSIDRRRTALPDTIWGNSEHIEYEWKVKQGHGSTADDIERQLRKSGSKRPAAGVMSRLSTLKIDSERVPPTLA